jgi:hypothetical protein
MKLIVSNHQLYKVLTSYLNSVASGNVEYPGNYIVVYYDGDEDSEVVMEFDKDSGNKLSIHKPFINTFVSLCPFNIEQAQEFIKEWFENEFNVTIDSVEITEYYSDFETD